MGVSEPLAGASAPQRLDAVSSMACPSVLGSGGWGLPNLSGLSRPPPQGGERRRGAQALGSFRTLSALHKRLQSSVGLALREPLV